MTSSKGTNDCISGDAIKPALEMPSSDATGLIQAAPQAPLLHTVKNNGIMELKLPVIVVEKDLILFIF